MDMGTSALQIEKNIELSDEEDRKLVEQSLKILKVLYFISTNVHLFTSEGITFMLLKSSAENELKDLAFNDAEL